MPVTFSDGGVGVGVGFCKVALNLPVVESASPVIEPKNIRPCENSTKVPIARAGDEEGTLMEKTPSEFRGSLGVGLGVGLTPTVAVGLGFGTSAPANEPVRSGLVGGKTGPPLIA